MPDTLRFLRFEGRGRLYTATNSVSMLPSFSSMIVFYYFLNAD